MSTPPPLPSPIISVRDLRRRFDTVEAVAGVSFDIYPGQVVGFIGANGAGKTTTMRMMVTLEIPDGGTIEIGGMDVVNFPAHAQRQVGWMPDNFGTYELISVAEYLDFCARALGFRGGDRRARVAEVMDFTDLTPLADRPMNKLSKGMGQRLCLGRTLLHDPPILILDEPAAGLDPQARIEFKHLVRLLAKEGKTIFISSHILSELGEMCDQLIFVHDGRLVHQGTSESLDAVSGAVALVEVRLADDSETAARWAELQPGVTLVETLDRRLRLAVEDAAPEALAALLRRMVQDGLPVSGFTRETRKLEDAFVDMVNKQRAAAPAGGNS